MSFNVEGAIFSTGNQPLHGVTLTMEDMYTGNVISSMVLEYNKYKAWSDEDAYLVFSKKGYKEQKIPLSTLAQNPDVFLSAGNSLPLLLLAGVGVAYVLSDDKKKKVGAIDNEKIKSVLLITGGVVGLSLIKQLLDKLGLGADPSAADQVDPGSPWKPSYWQQFNSFTYAINQATAEQYSKTIHNAFTITQDDFNAIKSVFFALRTKANVSYLSYIFSHLYNEDLLTFLTNGGGILPWDGLSQSQMQVLIDYVNNLPKN